MTYQVKIQIVENPQPLNYRLTETEAANTVVLLDTNSLAEARTFTNELIDVADSQDFRERVEEAERTI